MVWRAGAALVEAWARCVNPLGAQLMRPLPASSRSPAAAYAGVAARPCRPPRRTEEAASFSITLSLYHHPNPRTNKRLSPLFSLPSSLRAVAATNAIAAASHVRGHPLAPGSGGCEGRATPAGGLPRGWVNQVSLPTAVEKGTQLVLSTAAHPLPPTPRMIERDQAKLVAMKEKLAACGLFRAVGRGFDLRPHRLPGAGRFSPAGGRA